tara:strand:- start:326 stop:541 length:216 start_codon:yes stop_codon:yes gene_type:complete
MAVLEALVVGVQVDLKAMVVQHLHQDKVTQVVMLVVLLLVEIILEELEAVVQVQQEVSQQAQTIQLMEQVA